MRSWRKIHRWIALVVTLPLIIITVTGLMLQLRNQFEWIQPKSIVSELDPELPLLTLEKAIALAEGEKVDQVIWRPGKKNLALRLANGTELQVHPQTGEILKAAKRRTAFLIDLHQGSWFGSWGQYFIYIIAGWGLALLIITGIIIYPFKKGRKP